MNLEYVYKEQFAVIGKLGSGPAENPWNWIKPVWDEANGNFPEIESMTIKSETGSPAIWGIMSDNNESFARWDQSGGKYLACCEVTAEVISPEGWVKWMVPSQTYLVAKLSQKDYGTVFDTVINEYIPANRLKLIGAVHEHYPEPGNPDVVELYFPIAKGNYFCQSCGMPMNSHEDRGTNQDHSISEDYCQYCYKDGEFTSEDTMIEMIESCIPFALEEGSHPDEKTAREVMLTYFPALKRWKSA
jgi:predicted transcriptional regulator YdeE